MRGLFLLVCAVFLVWSVAAPTEPLVTVIDGDTLDLNGTRYRIANIDAPERGQTCTDKIGNSYPCGQRATEAMRRLVATGRVTCGKDAIDQFGRTVAHCHVSGTDIGAAMVEQGHARAYLEFGDEYLPQEQLAQKAGLGIWAGSHDAPWDFRPVPAAAPRPAPDPACVIKGNISSKGTRIYHVPGQEHYDRTRIDPSKGERWFCSEFDAQKEGWRKARR